MDIAIVGGAGSDLVLTDITSVTESLVAIGNDRRGGVVLSSPDGVQWTRAPDNPSLDSASLTAVARGRGMTAVVGKYAGSNRGFLWTSADGAHWNAQGAPFTGGTSVTDIAASPSAYVASGTFRTAPDALGSRRTVAAVWTSDDGRRWDRFLLPLPAASGDFRPTLVRHVGSRFVAFGRFLGTTTPADVLVWTSTDGRHWQRGEGIRLPHEETLLDVAAAPNGMLVAVGGAAYEFPGHAAAFTSLDGLAWTTVPDQPALDGAAMRGVDCSSAGCVAVGSTGPGTGSAAAAWRSADGISWSRVDGIATLGSIGMRKVVRSPGGDVAIGWATVTLTDGSSVSPGAFWVAPPMTLPAAIPSPPVASIGGTWESLPPLATPRAKPVATVGADGRIYVFGGATRPAGTTRSIETSSVEIFDPVPGTWSAGPPIPGPGRGRAAAVTAADGRIYLFHRSSTLVLVYDPKLRTWTTGPRVPDGRFTTSAVAGPGRLISVATWHGSDPFWLYALDPATGRWTSRGAIAAVPTAISATGRLYALTAWRAWEINPVSGATRARAPAPTVTYGGSTIGPQRLVWQVGYRYDYPAPGFTGRGITPSVQAYDPVTNSWLLAPTPARVRYATALVATGNRLYVIGGSTGSTIGSFEMLVVADR